MMRAISPIQKVLIANRGEIALRIARTCREMGVRTVAVHSTADREALFVRYADEAVQIGPPDVRRSYLYAPSVLEAALRHGADAIHPGYGFLSEDPDFAQACAESGLRFIGPPAQVMQALGDKAEARRLMAQAGLPILPGSPGAVRSVADAQRVGDDIGFPLVVKAVAGGGGRGIEVAHRPIDLPEVFRRTSAFARQVFGNGDVYVERFVTSARHVEVQLLCDSAGAAVHLGERDCSLQRRNQKLIEESPAPFLPEALRARIGRLAVEAAKHLGYVGAGTMEMLVASGGEVTFMEINARIQVEHPVTEVLTGIDIVREQIRIASGLPLEVTQEQVQPRGVAIECRVNAEDPEAGWRPTPGLLEVFRPPSGPGVRVDAGFVEGDRVPPTYDSLLAKVIVWAATRDQAIARADRALAEFEVSGPGVRTTIPVLRKLLQTEAFVTGTHSTRFVDEFMAERTPTLWVA